MRKQTRTRTPKYVVKLTLQDALALGIVFCDCGHPPNNHFDFDGGKRRPCAHCKCEQLHTHFSRGKAL